MSLGGRDGEDLVAEVERVTEFEGMVDLCRDLRDAMTFYDREVLLATFTGIVEGMMISALFEAGGRGPAALAAVRQRLEGIVRSLPKRLAPPPGPLDVESLVHRFLDVGARGLAFNFPVYAHAIEDYFAGREDMEGPIDRRLLEAWREAGRDGPDPALLGPAGAAVLRGARPSSAWLRLEGRGVERIQALWTLRDAIASLPGIAFPLGPAREARPPARWEGAVAAGARVVDLSTARRRRRAAFPDESAPDQVPLDDAEEEFWDAVFDEGPLPDEAVAYAQRHPEVRWPLLAIPLDEGLQEAAEDGDAAIVHAVELLEGLVPEAAAEALVTLAGALDPDGSLFAYVVDRLLALEPAAMDRVVGVIAGDDLRTAARLAPVLAASRRARRDMRVFDLLADLLRRTGWADGKERVAAALEAYGDARAVPLLESALATAEPRSLYQEAVVRRAVDRLTRGRGGHRP
ncbi:MAG: hypothetical protein K6V73_04650 [Firmicutes bacterium]|nr:hypothetical protein [Bacillota bacterium]